MKKVYIILTATVVGLFALAGYWQHDGWEVLIKRAMGCDNSWAKSATEYINLYREVIDEN